MSEYEKSHIKFEYPEAILALNSCDIDINSMSEYLLYGLEYSIHEFKMIFGEFWPQNTLSILDMLDQGYSPDMVVEFIQFENLLSTYH